MTSELLDPGFLRGGDMFEGFRIERHLGSGGQGVVYLAYDPVLDKQRAIKTLRRSGNDEERFAMFCERFLREARTLAKLEHKNIVEVRQVGKHVGPSGETPFMVMDYVEAVDLNAWRRLSPSLEDIQAVLVQLADALSFCHQNGVLHRDIKPANVLVTDENQVRLIDFGIARADLDVALTQTGGMIGTIPYWAPEYLNDSSPQHTELTDIWAFGCTAYKTLTGKNPFDNRETGERGPLTARELADAQTGQRKPIEWVRENISPEFVAVIDSCLKPDPSLRVQSVAEVARLLRSAPARIEGFDASVAEPIVKPLAIASTHVPSRASSEIDPSAARSGPETVNVRSAKSEPSGPSGEPRYAPPVSLLGAPSDLPSIDTDEPASRLEAAVHAPQAGESGAHPGAHQGTDLSVPEYDSLIAAIESPSVVPPLAAGNVSLDAPSEPLDAASDASGGASSGLRDDIDATDDSLIAALNEAVRPDLPPTQYPDARSSVADDSSAPEKEAKEDASEVAPAKPALQLEQDDPSVFVAPSFAEAKPPKKKGRDPTPIILGTVVVLAVVSLGGYYLWTYDEAPEVVEPTKTAKSDIIDPDQLKGEAARKHKAMRPRVDTKNLFLDPNAPLPEPKRKPSSEPVFEDPDLNSGQNPGQVAKATPRDTRRSRRPKAKREVASKETAPKEDDWTARYAGAMAPAGATSSSVAPTASSKNTQSGSISGRLSARLTKDLYADSGGVSAVTTRSKTLGGVKIPTNTKILGKVTAERKRIHIAVTGLRLPNGTVLDVKGLVLDKNGRKGLLADPGIDGGKIARDAAGAIIDAAGGAAGAVVPGGTVVSGAARGLSGATRSSGEPLPLKVEKGTRILISLP